MLLHGDLGAGKTAFVRGLASGLGIDPDDVSSPTFVLIQHYKGRMPLTHVDLYRLDSARRGRRSWDSKSWRDGGVVAIEWAERLPRPLDGSVTVKIEDLGDDRRRITIERGTRNHERANPATSIPIDSSALPS